MSTGSMNSRATFPKKPKQNNLAPHGLATRGAFFMLGVLLFGRCPSGTRRGDDHPCPYYVGAAAARSTALCKPSPMPPSRTAPAQGAIRLAASLRPLHPSKKRNNWRCGLVFYVLCVLGVFGGILIPPPFCFLR
jgi:hypothetical protein